MSHRLTFLLLAMITVGGLAQAVVSARTAAGGGETKTRKVTARCSHASVSRTDPNWERRSTTAWRFGLYGPNRDFRKAHRRPGRSLVAKIPAIIEGPRSFVLRVPKSQRGKVGLAHGPAATATRISDAATQVTFMPCRAKTQTGWPGGLLLKNRDPIKLRVRRESDEVAAIRIGRLP